MPHHLTTLLKHLQRSQLCRSDHHGLQQNRPAGLHTCRQWCRPCHLYLLLSQQIVLCPTDRLNRQHWGRLGYRPPAPRQLYRTLHRCTQRLNPHKSQQLQLRRGRVYRTLHRCTQHLNPHKSQQLQLRRGRLYRTLHRCTQHLNPHKSLQLQLRWGRLHRTLHRCTQHLNPHKSQQLQLRWGRLNR